MVKTSAIIMASGFSKRMGTNKLFLEYQGKTFIERTFDLIDQIDFYEKIIVISRENAEKITIPDTYKVVYNQQAKSGQSASVRMGTIVASGEGYLFLPADQPLLDCGTINKILAKGDQDNIVYPKNLRGNPSSPTFFGKRFRQELLSVEGEEGGRTVRKKHLEACYGVIVPDDHVLIDVDTTQDYQRLLNLPASTVSRLKESQKR